MADFTQSFTGKGTGIVLPENKALQAQQGLSAIIKEAEQLRYQVYEKNRNEFLKNANIDLAFVFSDSARKYIAESIDKYNDKYGKLAKKYNYNLPIELRMEQQTEKNLIIAEQQNQQVQYELWKQHRDLVAKNPGIYNVEEFARATDSFMQNGVYNQSTPAYEPHDFGQALRKAYLNEKNKIPIDMQNIGGGKQVERYYTTSEENYNGLISNIIASDPNARAGLFKEIEQNREEVFRNADKDGNNVLDNGERENAIISWVKQRYPRLVVTGTPTTIPGYTKGIPTATAKAKEQAMAGVQSESVPKTFGSEGDQRTYSSKSFHFDGGTTIKNISTQGGVALDKYGAEDIQAGVVDAELVLYDPVKKVFLIKSMKTSQSTGQPSNAIIEVPRKNIRNYDSIPLKMGDVNITVKEADEIYKYGGKTPIEPIVPKEKKKLY